MKKVTKVLMSLAAVMIFVLGAVTCVYATGATESEVITNGRNTVAVKSAVTPTVKLSSSSGNIGNKITVTASGGSQYKFVWSQNNWQRWGVIKAFNATNTASFTPTVPGNYTIYADVMGANGNVTTKTATYTAKRDYSFDLEIEAPNPVVGATISAEVDTSGNTTGMKYKFVWSYNNWDKWGVISPLSTTKNVTFKPTAGQGNYTIYVDVIDRYGNVNTSSESKNINLANVSSVKAGKTSVSVGETVTITGSSTGISPKYKFVWSQNNWANWGVIKSMNSTKTCTFTPAKAGTYTIYMDVQDAYGNVATKSININATAGWSLNSVKASVTSTTVGSPVTITANVSGTNTGSLTYKFVSSYNNGSEWKVLRNFAKGNSVSFTPTKAGTYEFYVDAKDAYGNIITKSTKINISVGWSFTSISGITNGATVKDGTSVTVKPVVSGNTSNLSYKFVWSYNNWSNWGIISNGKQNSAVYTPTKNGRYDIYVDVYDAYGNVVTRSVAFTHTTSSGTSTNNTKSLTGINNRSYSAQVFTLVNQERKAKGLTNLKWDQQLADAALLRAAETVVLFDHKRPNGTDCYTVSSKMMGENISTGYSTPQAVMTGWMNSTGHRENILRSNFTTIGIGTFTYNGTNYCVQAFGTGTNSDETSGPTNTTNVTVTFTIDMGK